MNWCWFSQNERQTDEIVQKASQNSERMDSKMSVLHKFDCRISWVNISHLQPIPSASASTIAIWYFSQTNFWQSLDISLDHNYIFTRRMQVSHLLGYFANSTLSQHPPHAFSPLYVFRFTPKCHFTQPNKLYLALCSCSTRPLMLSILADNGATSPACNPACTFFSCILYSFSSSSNNCRNNFRRSCSFSWSNDKIKSNNWTKNNLVPERLELSTLALLARCSNRLSYGTMTHQNVQEI